MASGISKISLFPVTSGVNDSGHLVIGGCDCVVLGEEFGTPLYVFDEVGLRRKCAEFRAEFSQRYADTTVIYASKAFASKALALIFKEEGLGLDVVSGGEMGIARAVDFPMDRVYFHGNNKSAEELDQAVAWQVGRIVVDNSHELAMLNEIAGGHKRIVDILLRLSPGVDPHTHQYNTTGIVDSKFGFTLSLWEEAVAQAMSAPNLNLIGLHFHLGSLIFEAEPYQEAIGIVLSFAAEMKRKHGLELKELNIGGGFAIQYTLNASSPPVSFYAEVIASVIVDKCRELGLLLPRLVIEPGRSIVGQSAVALYKVGVVKDIPGVRCYVSVDGGMGDNIRPALYGAAQEAVAANKMREDDRIMVTVAGKFCESGDILIRDLNLPLVSVGDLVAVAGCGAYCLPLASNYNATVRPAVVLVKEGKARLIRRRESLEDLTRCDLI
ncbi:diaminopimelate decarboxylase [Chloroflexota bacterium]